MARLKLSYLKKVKVMASNTYTYTHSYWPAKKLKDVITRSKLTKQRKKNIKCCSLSHLSTLHALVSFFKSELKISLHSRINIFIFFSKYILDSTSILKQTLMYDLTLMSGIKKCSNHVKKHFTSTCSPLFVLEIHHQLLGFPDVELKVVPTTPPNKVLD